MEIIYWLLVYYFFFFLEGLPFFTIVLRHMYTTLISSTPKSISLVWFTFYTRFSAYLRLFSLFIFSPWKMNEKKKFKAPLDQLVQLRLFTLWNPDIAHVNWSSTIHAFLSGGFFQTPFCVSPSRIGLS